MKSEKLTNWYEKNHRKLPFRETKNPYYIWISEVMLQQTQVDTVLPYFQSFIKKYPTIDILATTPLEEVLKSVEGLGYYRRFRNMHKAAIYIHEKLEDVFPNTYKELLNMPGIGRYTAGAIMSIAYNKPYSALDGNVIRVLTRFFNTELDMSLEKNRKILDNINQEIIEKMPSADIYTQSMMELGATICKPTEPKCAICPLKDECLGNILKNATNYPKSMKKVTTQNISYFTFIIKSGDSILLRKRNEKLLEGFYEYIQVEAESINYAIEQLSDLGISVFPYVKYLSSYKHIFTHQVWQMHVYEATLHNMSLSDPDYELIDNISAVPMAIAHRKIKY